MLPTIEPVNLIKPPPPSYEQVINNQQQRPPSYHEVVHNELPSTSSSETVKSAQSETLSWLQEINIVGISKGEKSAGKDITYFSVFSNNYLAVNQQIDDCCCYPGNNYFTILDTKNNTRNNVLFSYKSKLPIKSIAVSPDNQSVAMLLGNNENNENNELALFTTNSVEARSTSLKDALLAEKNNINLLTDKPYSTCYDRNGDLYLAGLKNQQVILWRTKFTLANQSTNWREVTSFDADSNTEVSFSKDGTFLFALQSNKTLKVFANNCNWSQIKTIPKIETLPTDINSTGEFMVFVDQGTLQIHELNTDTYYVLNSIKSVTAACFIPDTKNLLVFDKDKKIRLLEYHDNNWIIDNNKSINLNVIVTQAYFNPNDKAQLIILFAELNQDEEIVEAAMASAFMGVFGGPIGGLVKTCCCDGGLVECFDCTSLCWRNIGIGLGSGLGIAFSLYSLFSVARGIDDYIKMNEVDTKLKTLKQPNSNVIERF